MTTPAPIHFAGPVPRSSLCGVRCVFGQKNLTALAGDTTCPKCAAIWAALKAVPK